MHTLPDIPYDVIQLIASLLLPYDVLALSSTCSALRPIKNERAVWLQIADSLSTSRPLPFVAIQAVDLPLETIIGDCLRAERIAKKWAEPHIYPRRQPARISFPDRRIVTYFKFLPGSRHVMVLDALNVLSCWTTDGQLLDSIAVHQGGNLIRWKPCDEESSYDIRKWGPDAQAVEIMMEYSATSSPTLRRLILLVYTPKRAGFATVCDFQIPSIFKPFSALTQDELCGGLVRLNTEPERVGIFLTNKITEKSICIDTGLRLVIQCIPQALLSSTHIVLYCESSTCAHAYAYRMDDLLELLDQEGHIDGDSMIRFPVQMGPTEICRMPFHTVNAHTCVGCGAHINNNPPSTDLSGNRDAFPIIIPKWHTFREDLRRNRTRSVLTFSRRPLSRSQIQAQALALYVNPPHYNTLHIHLVDGDDQQINLNGDEGAFEGGHMHNPQGPGPSHTYRFTPRTTIAHHYFDLDASLSGDGPREIVRTVLADAPLRRLQSLRINQHHAQALVAEDRDPTASAALDARLRQQLASYGDTAGQNGFGVDDDAQDEEMPQEENDEDDDFVGIQHGLQSLNIGAVPQPETFDHDQSAQNLDAAATNPAPGSAAEPFDARDGVPTHTNYPQTRPQAHHHHAGSVWNLTPHGARALVDILQDPFSGSPVIGFGGRCAMWVEEHPIKRPGSSSARYELEPLLRVATFPAYKPPEDDETATLPVHRELEGPRACVGTLHLPGYIPLESSYAFDLDDVRGLVGIATLYGDLWLVDFS